MKPKRIQLKRSRGWRMPPNTVSVARPGRWGNSFRVNSCTTAVMAVKLFGLWVDRELAREELRGKNLACWCPLDQPCHADVLLEIANDLDQASR